MFRGSTYTLGIGLTQNFELKIVCQVNFYAPIYGMLKNNPHLIY